MSTSTSSLSAPAAPPVVPRTSPWVAGGAGAMALLAVAGWFLVVSPQRSAMADTDEAITQAQSNVDLLTTRVAQLKQQYASLPELQAQLASLQAQLPADAALPELVRALRAAATSSGAELTALTPSAPEAFGSDSAAAAPAAAATTGTTTGATAGADGAAAPSDSATAAATGTPATSTATTGGAGALLQIPVTITATGSYASLQGFLANVQRQQRLLLVTGTSFAPGGGADSKDLTLTVTGDVFVLPGEVGAAAAAGTSPTSVPTAVPTAVPTSSSTSVAATALVPAATGASTAGSTATTATDPTSAPTAG